MLRIKTFKFIVHAFWECNPLIYLPNVFLRNEWWNHEGENCVSSGTELGICIDCVREPSEWALRIVIYSYVDWSIKKKSLEMRNRNRSSILVGY